MPKYTIVNTRLFETREYIDGLDGRARAQLLSKIASKVFWFVRGADFISNLNQPLRLDIDLFFEAILQENNGSVVVCACRFRFEKKMHQSRLYVRIIDAFRLGLFPFRGLFCKIRLYPIQFVNNFPSMYIKSKHFSRKISI